MKNTYHRTISTLGFTFNVIENIEKEVIRFTNSNGTLVGTVKWDYFTGDSKVSLIDYGIVINTTTIPAFEDFLEPSEADEIFAKALIKMINEEAENTALTA